MKCNEYFYYIKAQRLYKRLKMYYFQRCKSSLERKCWGWMAIRYSRNYWYSLQVGRAIQSCVHQFIFILLYLNAKHHTWLWMYNSILLNKKKSLNFFWIQRLWTITYNLLCLIREQQQLFTQFLVTSYTPGSLAPLYGQRRRKIQFIERACK